MVKETLGEGYIGLRRNEPAQVGDEYDPWPTILAAAESCGAAEAPNVADDKADQKAIQSGILSIQKELNALRENYFRLLKEKAYADKVIAGAAEFALEFLREQSGTDADAAKPEEPRWSWPEFTAFVSGVVLGVYITLVAFAVFGIKL